jgi:hypothetical protein
MTTAHLDPPVLETDDELGFDAWLDDQRELVLAADDDEDAVEAPDGRRYRIRDAAHADWALGKLSARRARIAAQEEFAADRCIEFERFAAAQVADVREWLERATAADRRDARFFEGLVIGWGGAQVLAEFARLEDWSKVTKRIVLPNGTFRAVRAAKGQFVAPAEAVRAAALTLSEIDRDDLCEYIPKLTATRLEQAVADGLARVGDDGTFEVRVLPYEPEVWVRLEGVRREGRGEITFEVETS